MVMVMVTVMMELMGMAMLMMMVMLMLVTVFSRFNRLSKQHFYQHGGRCKPPWREQSRKPIPSG